MTHALLLSRRSLACLTLLAFAVGGLSGCGDGSSSYSDSSAPSNAVASMTPGSDCPKADGSSPRRTTFSDAPGLCIDTKKTYTTTMATDVGTMIIDLDAAKAPMTVNNFIVLSRFHFYDGLTFHRVVPGVMAQGGDPEGNGQGGPGYMIKDELPSAGAYKVGSVAMAKTQDPDTGGSQFFIVSGGQGVALPPNYALFGQVAKGLDVLKKIDADGNRDGSQEGTPVKTHHITTVTISER